MDAWTLAALFGRWSRPGAALAFFGAGTLALQAIAPSTTDLVPFGAFALVAGASLVAADASCRLAVSVLERAAERRARRASERRRRERAAAGLANLGALTDAEAAGLLAILRRGDARFVLPPDLQGLRDKQIVFVETVVYRGDSVHALNPAIAARRREVAADLAARLDSAQGRHRVLRLAEPRGAASDADRRSTTADPA